MADEGGVWRTISGRRVFIRDGQSLSDAMNESGKFQEEKTVYFDAKKLGEARNLPEIQEIIEEKMYDYGFLGFRAQDEDTDEIGATMTHHSSNWGGDFEGLEEEELDGVSTIGANATSLVDHSIGYGGKVLYLLGSQEGEYGYDPGEYVLKDATVLAKIRVKDGKLTVTDKIKTSTKDAKEEASKVISAGTNTNTYAGTRAQVNEYISFKFEMEKKYGADGLWSAMSDNEYEQYERLERIAYRGK